MGGGGYLCLTSRKTVFLADWKWGSLAGFEEISCVTEGTTWLGLWEPTRLRVDPIWDLARQRGPPSFHPQGLNSGNSPTSLKEDPKLQKERTPADTCLLPGETLGRGPTEAVPWLLTQGDCGFKPPLMVICYATANTDTVKMSFEGLTGKEESLIRNAQQGTCFAYNFWDLPRPLNLIKEPSRCSWTPHYEPFFLSSQ